jgi:hypothetical protein
MGYITFEFNNIKYRIKAGDSEIEKRFEDITGIKIERKITQDSKNEIEITNNKSIPIEKAKQKKHPSVDDLIELFMKQPSFEFGSGLIKQKFYPNINKKIWRKTLPVIYPKIKKAMGKIEEQEKGHYITRKEGKYTYYKFYNDKDKTLLEF